MTPAQPPERSESVTAEMLTARALVERHINSKSPPTECGSGK